MVNKDRLEVCQEKHKRIQEILIDLSKSQTMLTEDLESFYKRLFDIYGDKKEFRHLYSSIFGYLTQIDNDSELNLEVLTQNIYSIYTYCFRKCEEEKEDFFDKIEKLYDHVNLDISRINLNKMVLEKNEVLNNYINKINSGMKETNDSIKSLQENATKVQKNYQELFEEAEGIRSTIKQNFDKAYSNIDKAENNIKAIAEKAEKAQRDYITILGIFATIVITFMAGMSFSASILNNMKDVTIYRLILSVVMVGLVIINTVSVLTCFLERVSDYNSKKTKWYCNPVNIINIVLILILVILLVIWCIAFYEYDCLLF